MGTPAMSDQPVSIPVPGSAELHLSTVSGHVTVRAEERADVLIESGAPREERIAADATGRIALRSARAGSANLEVRCPLGSDVSVGSVSGQVRLEGRLGVVRVNTVSGHVEIGLAESVDARTISGDVAVERCDARCRVQSKSGKAVVRSAGDALVSTFSGEIRLDEALGDVRAQTASGRVDVALGARGDVAVQTMSGSVRVAVPPDVRPAMRLRTLAGRPRCDCPEGSDCEIRVQSLSGKIEVVPA
jgi:DUF4097 and DUF4098 domain-containing protein YvlB